MNEMRILFPLLITLIVGCSHPLEIEGQGDIESSTGNNDCSLEEQPCTNLVAGIYNVTYTAIPRQGWKFVEWEGCGEQYPLCSLSIAATTVQQFWFQTMPPLRAVFEVEPDPEEVLPIAIGDVRGHTVSQGSIAHFGVTLTEVPQADVTIDLVSSDESEGLLESSQLVFTAANWHLGQDVAVIGQNPSPTNDMQDYQILLTVTSADPQFNGINIPPVLMRGIYLEVDDPIDPISTLSKLPLQRSVPLTYTGDLPLTYTLVSGPSGMTIDLSTGSIEWTPQESDEGQSHFATIDVSDGSLVDTATLEIQVLQPSPLSVSATPDSISIVEPGSNLDGIELHASAAQPSTNFLALNIETLGLNSVPPLPEWIKPITDVMVLPDAIEEGLSLKINRSSWPSGYGPGDVNVYRLFYDEEVGDAFWVDTSLSTQVQSAQDGELVVLDLSGLEGMAIVGVHRNEPGEEAVSPNGFSAASQSSAIPGLEVNCMLDVSVSSSSGTVHNCSPGLLPWFTVKVKNWGDANKVRWTNFNREPGMRIEELAESLVAAYFSMASLGMTPLPQIGVTITRLPNRGMWNSGEPNSVFLDGSISYSSQVMPTTAVHEYFHHGQFQHWSSGAGRITNKKYRWLVEGSARWFEEFNGATDVLNGYVVKELNQSIPRVLEAGLDAYPSGVSIATKPYKRFNFFQVLSNRCSNFFAIAGAFTFDKSSDPTGVRSLVAAVENASCNFEAFVGNTVTEKASLEAAMALFQYATIRERSMTRLDSDEPAHTSQFPGPNSAYEFKRGNTPFPASIQEWITIGTDVEFDLTGVTSVPRSGAISFDIPAIQGPVPPGMRGELMVNAPAGVTVSIWSQDLNVGSEYIFQGSAASLSFDMPQDKSFRYGNSADIPEIFVTLINSSPDQSASVSASFKMAAEGEPITDRVYQDGKEWAQVDLFYSVSWTSLMAACPGGVCLDGTAINGHDLSGWKVASVSDLNSLFNSYIGSNEMGPGPDEFSAGFGNGDEAVAVAIAQAFTNDGWRVSAQRLRGHIVGSGGSHLKGEFEYFPGLGLSLTTNEAGAIGSGVGAWLYYDP